MKTQNTQVDYTAIIASCGSRPDYAVDTFLNLSDLYQNNPGLEEELDKLMAPFAHLWEGLNKDTINHIKSNLLAIRLFGAGGPMHADVDFERFHKNKSVDDGFPAKCEVLCLKAGRIVSQCADGLFEMEEYFSGSRYLLYSPLMQDLNKKIKPQSWLYITGDNGTHYRAHGMTIPLRFTAEDLLYYAKCVNQNVRGGMDVLVSMNIDPVPFLALQLQMDLPEFEDLGFKLKHCRSTDQIDHCEPNSPDLFFTVRWNADVWEYESLVWSKAPHCAYWYYDEKKGEILRTARTEEGFCGITSEMEACAILLDTKPQLSVSLGITVAAKENFPELELFDSRELLFDEKDPQQRQESMDRIEKFTAVFIEKLRCGEAFDFGSLAEELGLTEEEFAPFRGVINSFARTTCFICFFLSF